MQIDLNADLGEGMGDDAAMLDVVSSANVACGGHAGDADSMRTVCADAVARQVRIGAHVSYADREDFGRAEMDIGPVELLDELREQLGNLVDAAHEVGGVVTYIKPHGALYHRVTRDPEHAAAVVMLASESGLALVGPPGSLVLHLADQAGVATVAEAFADRGYRPDGGLVPRGEPGALLHDPDPIAARMVALVRDGEVTSEDGGTVAVVADSICVHSDSPGAVAIARAVRAALIGAGVTIAPPPHVTVP